MNETKNPLKSVGIAGPAAALLVYLANWRWPGLGVTETDEIAP